MLSAMVRIRESQIHLVYHRGEENGSVHIILLAQFNRLNQLPEGIPATYDTDQIDLHCPATWVYHY